VECIDFSRWVLDNFKEDDHIIVKMDIEGAEFRVLVKMIHDGSINYINELYVEWHFAFDDFPDKNLHNILVARLRERVELFPEMKKCMEMKG